MNQLPIFESINENDEKLIEEAIRIRELAAKYLEDKTSNIKSSEISGVCLDIITRIRPLSKEKPEPNDPRLTLKSFDVLCLLSEMNSRKFKVFETRKKKLPEFTENIHTDENVSEDDLLYLLKQYFSLEFLDDIAGIKFQFSKIIQEFIKNKHLIIRFNCLLSSRIKVTLSSQYLQDLMHDVNNRFNKLRDNSIEKGIIVLGTDIDFRHCNDIIGEFEQVLDEKYSRFFNNDYTLLNNTELISDEPITSVWSTSVITPPVVLEGQDCNETYIYSRQTKDSRYIRTDMYIDPCTPESLISVEGGVLYPLLFQEIEKSL